MSSETDTNERQRIETFIEIVSDAVNEYHALGGHPAYVVRSLIQCIETILRKSSDSESELAILKLHTIDIFLDEMTDGH